MKTERQTPALDAHLPALDGLRAIAVLLVLLQHLGPPSPWIRRLGPGGLGVSLFFVLSGFLITRILLTHRPIDRAGLWPSLKAFYARRFLRIFPLYYAVLLGAMAAGEPSVRRSFWWHVTYLSNVYFARTQRWDGAVTPLWSLALEEQFYLAWPLIVFTLAPRSLRRVTLVLALGGPLFRLIFWRVFGADEFALLLPFGYTDLLFFGALLALCHADAALDRVRIAVSRAAWVLGLPFFVLGLFTQTAQGSALWLLTRLFHGTAVALMSFALLDFVAQNTAKKTRAALTAAPLAYLGKISYGIYLQHAFVHTSAFTIAGALGLTSIAALTHNALASGLIGTATAVLTATLSWYGFERPINALKARFAYPVCTPPATAALPL